MSGPFLTTDEEEERSRNPVSIFADFLEAEGISINNGVPVSQRPKMAGATTDSRNAYPYEPYKRPETEERFANLQRLEAEREKYGNYWESRWKGWQR